MDLEQSNVSRREFLGAAAIGAAVMAAGPVFEVVGKEEAMPMAKDIYVCGVCGHVEFGMAPENCPVCHAPKEKFTDNNTVFADAISNYKDAGISHTPAITVKKKSGLIPETPAYEIEVRIGKKLHPMEEAHRIAFIDCYVDDKYFSRMMLTLGSDPAATFYTKATGAKIRVVELFTVHGHWQAEAKVA
jgi:desulfoferrodoxin (superoxide reductase-like protein)